MNDFVNIFILSFIIINHGMFIFYTLCYLLYINYLIIDIFLFIIVNIITPFFIVIDINITTLYYFSSSSVVVVVVVVVVEVISCVVVAVLSLSLFLKVQSELEKQWLYKRGLQQTEHSSYLFILCWLVEYLPQHKLWNIFLQPFIDTTLTILSLSVSSYDVILKSSGDVL